MLSRKIILPIITASAVVTFMAGCSAGDTDLSTSASPTASGITESEVPLSSIDISWSETNYADLIFFEIPDVAVPAGEEVVANINSTLPEELDMIAGWYSDTETPSASEISVVLFDFTYLTGPEFDPNWADTSGLITDAYSEIRTDNDMTVYYDGENTILFEAGSQLYSLSAQSLYDSPTTEYLIDHIINSLAVVTTVED